MNSDTTAILALMLTPGGGTAAIRKLMAVAANSGVSLTALLERTPRELTESLPCGLEPLAKVASQCDSYHRDRATSLLESAGQAGVSVLRITDTEYPASIRASLDEAAPPLLFVYGTRELLDSEGAAIVGAREVSEGGALLAADCATTLTAAGATIISGGAPGVDSAAHQTALDAGGRTVVVLPQGILTYRGPSPLMDAAENGRAAILSEFAPDTRWQTHAAVTRNATISALSRLVCVIEPRKTGGSVRTARCALDQRKRVLVHGAPGAHSPIASLLRAGAESLLDDAGQFNPARLQQSWTSRPALNPAQADLFQPEHQP